MIDIVIVAIYLVVILGIGLWAGRQQKDLADYAVVGRSYGSLIIFATMSASFIGGGFSTGNAQKVFLFGIANIIGLWGFSLKEILVALFVAPKMDRFPNAISVGDIMATAYGKGRPRHYRPMRSVPVRRHRRRPSHCSRSRSSP
jgi:SSS family solute:Na+ symporter